MDSLGLTWIPLNSLGLPWTYLDSIGLTWAQLDSPGFTWTQLESFGVTWSHLESRGVTWIHLDLGTQEHIHAFRHSLRGVAELAPSCEIELPLYLGSCVRSTRQQTQLQFCGCVSRPPPRQPHPPKTVLNPPSPENNVGVEAGQKKTGGRTNKTHVSPTLSLGGGGRVGTQ